MNMCIQTQSHSCSFDTTTAGGFGNISKIDDGKSLKLDVNLSSNMVETKSVLML